MIDNASAPALGARTWLDVEVAGHGLRLSADRALYWPARRRLLIADLHLGKSEVLRCAGIAVPGGVSRHDLQRLQRLIDATGAAELWILGDLLHGPIGPREDWHAFVRAHPRLSIGAISGNHDRALHRAVARGDLIGLTLLGDAVDDAPFEFAHAPPAATPAHEAADSDRARHRICGHLHPVLRVPGFGSHNPAFWLRAHGIVLPAFSTFTGGQRIDLRAGERAAVCNGESIIAIGPKAGRARRIEPRDS